MDGTNGFICPECKKILTSHELLTAHFDEDHPIKTSKQPKADANSDCNQCKEISGRYEKLKERYLKLRDLLKVKNEKLIELKTLSDNLNALNAETETKIKSIQNQKSSEANNFNQQIKDLSSQNTSLKNLNQEIEKSKLFFKESSSKYKRMCEEINIKYENLVTDYNRLDIAHSKSSQITFNAEVDLLLTKNSESLIILKKAINEVRGDLVSFKQNSSKIETDIRNLFRKISSSYSSKIKKLTETKNAHIYKLQENVTKLNLSSEQLKSEKELLEQKLIEQQNTVTKFDEINQKLEKSSTLVAKLRNDIKIAKENEKVQLENTSLNISQLNSQIQELNTQIVHKTEDITILERKLNTKSKEYDTLISLFNELKITNNSKISELENKILLHNSGVSAKAYELNNLNEKFNELKLSKSETERIYNQSLIQIEKLNDANLELSNKIDQLTFNLELSENRFKENEVRSRQSTLALCELGSHNQKLQSILSCLLGKKWRDDLAVSHCEQCLNLFSVTIRKHHCRICGGIFCGNCTAHELSLASHKKDVRVCDQCFENISSFNQI